MVLVSGGITQPLLKMYTSAGVQLGVAVWDKGRIKAMGWTNEEELMIVEQTGEVKLGTRGTRPNLLSKLERWNVSCVSSPATLPFTHSQTKADACVHRPCNFLCQR